MTLKTGGEAEVPQYSGAGECPPAGSSLAMFLMSANFAAINGWWGSAAQY
jgi:hypothetical protein